jgi:hypothetical protein
MSIVILFLLARNLCDIYRGSRTFYRCAKRRHKACGYQVLPLAA